MREREREEEKDKETEKESKGERGSIWSEARAGVAAQGTARHGDLAQLSEHPRCKKQSLSHLVSSADSMPGLPKP